MGNQEKWTHTLNDRSEICVEPLREYLFLQRFKLFQRYFRKIKVKPSLYFYTARLNKIYFSVFPSDISVPNDFKLVIDSLKYPDMSNVDITFKTESNIHFDENYSIQVAEKPIQFHFPSPGLVVIYYHILTREGAKPLDKNGKEIFLAQRTLSGTIGRGYHDEENCNKGQIPIIVLDYHSKILIKLNWFLILLTVVLTILTFASVIKGG